MFSFGKRSVVFVLILFIVIALVGWAWRQRDSLPFITKPLMTIMSPFEYGASRDITLGRRDARSIGRVVAVADGRASDLPVKVDGRAWRARQ